MNNQNSQGQTTLITIGYDGALATPAIALSLPGIEEFSLPSISADGRYVAFSWHATNLVPDDTNDSVDVFVRDLDTGITELVSVAPDGTPGNDFSVLTSMSSDGRFVAFYSAASNLVPDDTNNAIDIFVRDRQTGITELVSVATDGSLANGGSVWPSISDDGRYVAFSSSATNLVPNITNVASHPEEIKTFVRDRQTGITELVSVSSDGTPANNTTGFWYWQVSISADGRYVSFVSAADNLVPNDNDNSKDIFVRDLQQGTTELVSIIANDSSDDYWGYLSIPSLSADGRYVAFDAYDSRLLAPLPDIEDYIDQDNFGTFLADLQAYYDSFDINTFIRDRQTGSTELVSVKIDGADGNNKNSRYSKQPSISADGRYVAFTSEASNLVTGDTNNSSDIFVRDLQTGITELVSVGIDGSPGNPSSFDPSFSSFNPSINADGRYIVFSSVANNLIPNNSFLDNLELFVRDRGNLFDPQSALTVMGTDEDDILTGSTEYDFISGLEGHDTLRGKIGDDQLFGHIGKDQLNGGEGYDTLDGGAGDDRLFGDYGNDQLNGGEGYDTLYGGAGADELFGDHGKDQLHGGEGNDTLYGGAGADELFGDNGNDRLNGGQGNDLLRGGAGADILKGDNGNDTLYGEDSNDILRGDNGNDILYGGAANDILYGEDNNDTLYGGDGNDILRGLNNNDLLSGGLGLDSLIGGLGSDRFMLVSRVTADQDLIQDYEDGVDLFELTGSLTFASLTITQVGANTEIMQTGTNETLATLIGVDAMTIDESDFS